MLYPFGRTLILCLLFLSSQAFCLSDAKYQVLTDADQNRVAIKLPVRRIISLAPNITELVFSAGGRDRLVGVTKSSDYPDEALQIPAVSLFNKVNFEKVIKLQADIIFVWRLGTSRKIIDKLRRLKQNVFVLAVDSFSDVARSLRILGNILGTQSISHPRAEQFESSVSMLKASRKTSKTVFIQIWHRPLITLNNKSLFSEAIQICGGENIFGLNKYLAPKVNIEAVIRADPDIILSTQNNNDFWSAWSSLKAVNKKQIHYINPDYINRGTLRSTKALKKICNIIQKL